MSNLTMGLYVAVLFVLLTPGILLRLPPTGSPLVVAIVHGAVFALVLCLTYKMVLRLDVEGFYACPDGSPPKQTSRGLSCAGHME
jgi:hypothetical protein